jgi:hypothetical protein
MSTAPPPLPPAQPPSFPPAAPSEKSAISIVLIVIGAVLLIIFIISALAGLAAPAMIRMKKKGDQVIAISNGRMLALTLNDFQAEYGSYPDRATAGLLASRKNHGLDLAGDHSNDYFRQLIAAGTTHLEDPFFAPTSISRVKPDNRTDNGHALAPGEVGWGYVMNGDASLPNTSPDIPLAVTPVMPADPGRFDTRPYQQKALVIHPDSSVRPVPLQRDGSALTKDGRQLLDAGPGTVWPAGVRPVIKPPAAR